MTTVCSRGECRNANFPDDVPAGKAMDSLVAEALGWHQDGNDWRNDEGEWQGYITAVGGREYQRAWSPSTDIAAAWQVAETLIDRYVHFNFNITAEAPSSAAGRYNVTLIGSGGVVGADADTAPLAICRALLKLWASGGY